MPVDFPKGQSSHKNIMKTSTISVLYATLVFSACFIQGFSLPQQRYTAEEYGRKFGSPPPYKEDNAVLSNSIEDEISPASKEDGSLVSTLIELGVKFLPVILGAVTGQTGPSQTDRIEGIDLNGEDPFSWKNMLSIGLKLFLAVAGGSAGGIEKSDNGPMQAVMGTVISALTGSDDAGEVQVMAKQATEVINLVITLVEALTTSISQRSYYR